MSVQTQVSFESWLDQFDSAAWAAAVAEILPSVHPVDRNATEIWFAFYPIELLNALEEAEDAAKLARKLLLQGKFLLRDNVDSSHEFLYGHKFWPQVRKTLIERARTAAPDDRTALARAIRDVASTAAKSLGVDESLVLGIAAVAFMTVHHVGMDAFEAASGTVETGRLHARSPEDALRDRAREKGQGLLGFLKSTNKEFTVTFDENRPDHCFAVVNNQDLATAGASEGRKYQAIDARRVEGPIPVECRTAACGTCWIGVVAGADKLSPVEARERHKLREFGYADTAETHPLVRLACVAKASGSVTVVVPPWNGVYGKYLMRRRTGAIDPSEPPATREV